MFAFRSPAHLPELDDMSATAVPDFDRERWTTCHIAHLGRGDLFALPGEPTVRPLVLTAKRVEEVLGETYGAVIGEARDLATGQPEEFKLRANTPVPVRCDLRYVEGQP